MVATNSCSNYVKYVLAPKNANPCSCCYNQNPTQNITINCEKNGACGGGGGTCGTCGGCLPEIANEPAGQVLKVKVITKADNTQERCLEWGDDTSGGATGAKGQDGLTVTYNPAVVVNITEEKTGSELAKTNFKAAFKSTISVTTAAEVYTFKPFAATGGAGKPELNNKYEWTAAAATTTYSGFNYVPDNGSPKDTDAGAHLLTAIAAGGDNTNHKD